MNVSPPFLAAHGVSPRCISAAWRGCSICFASTCDGPAAAAIPHQAARLGQAAIASETARLWVERAAVTADESPEARSAEQIVAYVNLARLAVERAALDLMELVHRSVGLQGFMRPHPIERISRDLATYLRQPGPDRALTSAADWTLRQETSSIDLWRNG